MLRHIWASPPSPGLLSGRKAALRRCGAARPIEKSISGAAVDLPLRYESLEQLAVAADLTTRKPSVVFTRRPNLHLAVCGGDKPLPDTLLSKNHLLPFLLLPLLQTAGRDLTAVAAAAAVVLMLFFLFPFFSPILLLHTMAFCFPRSGCSRCLCASGLLYMDDIVFLAEESEGTSREPWRLLRPHPSIFLFVLRCAALLLRHISAPPPPHLFLLRLP